eukprot:scaffold1707_cov357-Prasinococcus_capsulatus_cf.AAC.16
MWAMLAFCMANCATVGPLMKYYKGPAVYRTLFSLGYDFVISFQGIMLIAWSNQPDAPDWMFWAVMPFWWWSVQKLRTSAKYLTALAPEDMIPSFLDRAKLAAIGGAPSDPRGTHAVVAGVVPSV